MALSVSCGLGTEVSVPDSNRFGKASNGRWGAGDLRVCRMRGGGAECAAGSRASGVDDSAEGSRIRVTGSVEGADVDKDVPPVSAFSGLVFVSLMGIFLAPIAHRMLHWFHMDGSDSET